MQSSKDIKDLFDELSSKYDFMNNIISFGVHKLIKKISVKQIPIKDGAEILDLCCGTGDITKLISNYKYTKKVIGIDFSGKMLELAEKKNCGENIKYLEADCAKLPFENNTFDIVTISFGLRNIVEKNKAINEIKRVLKPGGLFFHLDFSNENTFSDKIFNIFTPFFAKIFCPKNISSFEYLIKSKKNYYTPKELEKVLKPYNFSLIKEKKFLISSVCAQVYTIIK